MENNLYKKYPVLYCKNWKLRSIDIYSSFQSLTIPDILHEVNWQNIDIALKKDIVLFLLRCKHPMCIRAANVTMTNHLIIEVSLLKTEDIKK